MLVTFDCYGTLLDTAAIGDVIANAGERAGISRQSAVAAFSSWEDRLMYGGEFIDFESLLVDALRRCDMELHTDRVFEDEADDLLGAFEQLAPFPDAPPALHRLKAMGIRLGMASNTSRHLLARHLHALDDVMDLSTCADEIEAYKPRDAVFARVSSWRREGEHHVHVAKGYWWDIEPAQRLGWKAIWINREGVRAPLQNSEIPQLPTLEGLPDLLDAHL